MLYLLTAAETANATNATLFCTQMSDMFKLIGLFITIIKIVIPILLIIFGMLDMGKAVTSGKDEDIKKQVMAFVRRLGAAVLVFFIPSIVGLVMTLINSAGATDTNNYCQCIEDILDVSSCYS